VLRNIPKELAGSELERRIKDSIDILTETGTEIRDIMVELQPPVLISYGLNAALNWGLNKFAERHNFKIVYCGKDLKERLPLNVELAYFRTFQEILHNISKHSKAKNINVIFEESDNIIKLQVEDDGVGFNLSDLQKEREKNSLGLVSMAERISIIGGKLEIVSGSGKGTTIRITREK
jgi:signal transduction histidine kinase